jgi:hypothetical protein
VSVTINGDRAATLDLYVALMAIGIDGLLLATLVATRNLGLYDLIRKACSQVPQRDSNMQAMKLVEMETKMTVYNHVIHVYVMCSGKQM